LNEIKINVTLLHLPSFDCVQGLPEAQQDDVMSTTSSSGGGIWWRFIFYPGGRDFLLPVADWTVECLSKIDHSEESGMKKKQARNVLFA
jgi:hypothetical protein